MVRLTVTDNDGLTDTATLTVTVANVAPVMAPIAAASLFAGGTYTASGTFTDPGADSWTATVDWGDGSAPSQAAERARLLAGPRIRAARARSR